MEQQSCLFNIIRVLNIKWYLLMMTQHEDEKREQMQIFCMNDLVPQDYHLRIIDKAIDWIFQKYDVQVKSYNCYIGPNDNTLKYIQQTEMDIANTRTADPDGTIVHTIPIARKAEIMSN